MTLFQYTILQKILNFFGVTASLGVCGLLFGIAIVSDMRIVLKSLNDCAIAVERDDLQTLKHFLTFIELHSLTKELSD